MFSIFKIKEFIVNISVNSNNSKKRLHKPGDIILVKTSEERLKEELYERENHICPECKRNQYESGKPVGGLEDYKYSYYRCNYSDCKAEWKVKK